MKTNKKTDLVTQILSLSMEISTNSIIDIFVDFSSHVQGLSVRVLLNGWNSDDIKYDFNKLIYLDFENSEEKLQAVVEYLKNLKETK